MSERFANMKKVPAQPAARILAAKATKLETRLDLPANASVEAVLAELDDKNAWVCLMRLLAAALPEREAVWWACVAARDIAVDAPTPCLKAAEAWVFEPNDANREKLATVLEIADSDDDTTLAATAALYAPGNLGTGELGKIEAPPGAVASCVFGMNMTTLGVVAEPLEHLQLLIDRAVDIARGGNGKIDPITPAPAPEPVTDDEDDEENA